MSLLALMDERLLKQKEELVNEFNVERSTHQKMIGEFSRLEQRFNNLQQELEIEKSSPDKRRRSQYDSGTLTPLSITKIHFCFGISQTYYTALYKIYATGI